MLTAHDRHILNIVTVLVEQIQSEANGHLVSSAAEKRLMRDLTLIPRRFERCIQARHRVVRKGRRRGA
jgi:hypothetical protein